VKITVLGGNYQTIEQLEAGGFKVVDVKITGGMTDGVMLIMYEPKQD
jgi:hypothetical protein